MDCDVSEEPTYLCSVVVGVLSGRIKMKDKKKHKKKTIIKESFKILTMES